jgi:DNA polymerase-1
MMHTDRTALIDADFIAYEAAAWAHSHQMDLDDVVQRVQRTLSEWTQYAFASQNIAFFSCPRDKCFRRQVWELYKAHRTTEPPAMLDAAKDALAEAADRVARMPTLEADDAMGIVATNGRVENPVICSVDKDMRGVPGWHWNPNRDDFPVYITEEQADRVFHTQWLTGDSTDGFKGIPKVGPKTAEKLLDCPADQWTVAVVEAYQRAKLDSLYCAQMAQCARILRHEDWDYATKRPILWTPPQYALDGPAGEAREDV